MSTVLNRFRFIFHLIFPEHIEIIRSLDLTLGGREGVQVMIQFVT